MARTAGSHSDITGPRVRAAAIKLFAESGYAAVSMRALAAEVGVQVGALYNYTPDKQSLLFEVMRDHMSEVLEAATDDVQAPAIQRLSDLVEFHITFHATRPGEIFIAYMELRNLTPQNFTAIEALRSRYEDCFETILKAGVAEGVFKIKDTKITTLAVIAMLTGINTWYRSGGRLSLDEVSAQYREMVLNAVGVTAQQPNARA
jgi:AcrR family transcriptional regulator